MILVKFFPQFGVLGILCRFFTAYFILNHLNVNFNILIIWIREKGSVFFLHVPISRNHGGLCSEGYLLSLGARTDCVISSPEPLGSQGELRAGVRPSVHHFQRSSLKPLDQSKPNFIWSLLGKGEPKFV